MKVRERRARERNDLQNFSFFLFILRRFFYTTRLFMMIRPIMIFEWSVYTREGERERERTMRKNERTRDDNFILAKKNEIKWRT